MYKIIKLNPKAPSFNPTVPKIFSTPNSLSNNNNNNMNNNHSNKNANNHITGDMVTNKIDDEVLPPSNNNASKTSSPFLQLVEDAFPGIMANSKSGDGDESTPKFKRPPPNQKLLETMRKGNKTVILPEADTQFRERMLKWRKAAILEMHEITDDEWEQAQKTCPIYSERPEELRKEGYCVQARRERKDHKRSNAKDKMTNKKKNHRQNFNNQDTGLDMVERTGSVNPNSWSDKVRKNAAGNELELIKKAFKSTFNKMTSSNASKLTVQGIVKTLIGYFGNDKVSIEELYECVAQCWVDVAVTQQQHAVLYGTVAHWLSHILPALEIMLIQGEQKLEEEAKERVQRLESLRSIPSNNSLYQDYNDGNNGDDSLKTLDKIEFDQTDLPETLFKDLPVRCLPMRKKSSKKQLERLESVSQVLMKSDTCSNLHCIQGEQCLPCIDKGIKQIQEAKNLFKEVKLNCQFRQALIQKFEAMYINLIEHNYEQQNEIDISETLLAEKKEIFNQNRKAYISALCQLSLRRLIPYNIIKRILSDCIIQKDPNDPNALEIRLEAVGIVSSGIQNIIQVVEETSYLSLKKRAAEVERIQKHIKEIIQLLDVKKHHTTRGEEYHMIHWCVEMMSIYLEKWEQGLIEHSHVCMPCERKSIEDKLTTCHAVTRVEFQQKKKEPRMLVLDEGGPEAQAPIHVE